MESSLTQPPQLTGSPVLQDWQIPSGLISPRMLASTPSQASGDLYYSNGSDFVRLSIGSGSQVLGISNGVPAWTAAPSGLPSPSSNGDILYSNGTNFVRLGIGSANQILTVISGIPSWQAAPASGVTSVAGTTNRITSSGGATPVIDISAAYVGQSSITTLGTIGTGLWNGTAISELYGGTNQTSYATGDLLYASTTNILAKRGIGSSGNVLTVSGGVPVWAAPAAVNPSVTNFTPNAGDTVTFDLSTSARVFKVTMPAGAVTLAVSNASEAMIFMVEIINSTGQGALTFFSTILWPGGVVPILTGTNTKKDTFIFRTKSSTTFDGYVCGQNI